MRLSIDVKAGAKLSDDSGSVEYQVIDVTLSGR